MSMRLSNKGGGFRVRGSGGVSGLIPGCRNPGPWRLQGYCLRLKIMVFAALCLGGAGSLAPAARGQESRGAAGTFLGIVTDPPGASVAVDRIPRGSSPLELQDLAPGKHLVAVSMRGYRDWFETVSLAAGVRRTLEARLEPIRGTALIRSEPAGANVSLDGAHRGVTPLLLTNLELGKHRVSITRPGFQDRVLDLEVLNANPQQLKASLLTDSATLRVNTDPAGAEVHLNGVLRGQAPVVLERIPDGNSELEIRYDGFAPHRQSIRLSAGDDETVSIVLAPLPASLQVVSQPPGARVYLDNQFRGETPLAIEALQPAIYRVRLELAAHDPMARDVTLGRAASRVEEFRLVANCGAIRVLTSPAGVAVLVDGKLGGTTAAKPDETDQVSEPLTIELVPVGRREVTFSRPGFYEQRRSVDVERDKTATLDVTLRRRFIPDYEVRTENNVYRGVLIHITSEFVRLETEVGVIRSFPLKDIKSRRPLRDDERIEPDPPPGD